MHAKFKKIMVKYSLTCILEIRFSVEIIQNSC